MSEMKTTGSAEEKKYIAMRKRKAFRESLLYRLMRVFPIQKKKIAVTTFEGRTGFCDNPRYIVEELHRRDPSLEFVWLMNDPDPAQFPGYVTVVKNTLINRAYHLSTSRIWIDNYRKPLGTLKRRGTVYFQTWHGSVAIKALGLHRGEAHSKIAHMVSSNDSDMTDHSLIDSDWGREIFRDGLLYYGDFLKTGTPRMDILMTGRDEQRRHIRERFGIPADSRIVIYCPTYREKGEKTERVVYNEPFSLDFNRLLDDLTKRFGGEWYLMVRLHPQMAVQLKEFPLEAKPDRLIDVSRERDMNEILSGTDAVITDISSTGTDASCAGIPVFLYIDDVRSLKKERGSFYWIFPDRSGDPIVSDLRYTPGFKAELPFFHAGTNDELEKLILSFDEEDYKKRVDRFYDSMGLLCDGHSSERAADEIEKYL